MVELKSIEQLLYFMKGHIHLSRYDEKFIDNISTLTTVTTNQVVLFHRLVFKYSRQFAKHELYVEKLVDLPWNVTVVESSPHYTDGHLSIKDNQIYFRCPFNRSFIDEFRKVPLNKFLWNKDKRYYEAPYNIYSLKILLNTAHKFFENIHCCEVSTELLDEVKTYENVVYWQPTLVKRNDNLYIVATNSTLDEALGDLKLAEDAKTLVTLSKYGISIGPEFHLDDPKLKFMSESITTIEQSDMLNLVAWLKEIECDMVVLSGSTSVNVAKRKLIEHLTDAGLEYLDTSIVAKSTKDSTNPVLVKFKKNFDSAYDPKKVTKIVHLVNSLPIDIK